MIAFERVTKIYSDLLGRRKTVGIRDVSFWIGKGEVLSLLGPNGAGKTTIIKILSGLLYPTEGRVLVRGMDVRSKRDKLLRSLGVVLGDSRSTYWRLTVKENLDYFGGLRNFGDYRGLGARIEELLRSYDLYDLRNRPVADLSKGMKQRLALACSLVADPDILLMDEPTEGLDAEATLDFVRLIRELTSSRGKTIVLATHMLDIAQEVSDKVCIISRGEVVANDTLEGLLRAFRFMNYEIEVEGKLTRETTFRLFNLSGVDIHEGSSLTRISLISDDQHLIYDVMGLLAGEGAYIRSILKKEPDLREVFLRIVGGERSHGLSKAFRS